MRSDGVKLLGVAAAISSLVADQMTKSWAVQAVASNGDVWVSGWFNIVSVRNEGVAFGLAQGAASWVLVALGVAITCVLAIWMVRSTSKIQALGLGMAIGGALGNIIDRVRLGAVRDFLDFYWRDSHWPAFNLADAFILAGLAIVILVNERDTRGTASKSRAVEGLADGD